MMGDKGYVISGMVLLFLIPLFILIVGTLTFLNYENRSNCNAINSKIAMTTYRDIERNIPIITLTVLNETAYDIINENRTITNSSEYIMGEVKRRIDKIKEYSNCEVECRINSVSPYTRDPFYIEVNSTIRVVKGNIKHEATISQLVSIEGLPDPLPFIKCSNISHNSTTIGYHNSLVVYLNNEGIENCLCYENATSPFLIKKCPYEPYQGHGIPEILIDCLKNGYYHESNDGACYLCRLEGRGSCPHQGIETFIIPGVLHNNPSIVSVDHVIFGGIYDGPPLIINSTPPLILFLDEGHKSKYGIQ